MEPFMLALLGVGLAGAAGFRVFVPPLLLSGAASVGLVDLPEASEWLSEPATVAILVVATLVEVAAYYVPLIDNLLDAVTTPLSLVAGTLLAGSVMPEMEPWLRWALAALLGGGAAGSVQTMTALTRAASTGATAGLANPVVATGELVGAFGLSIVALVAPVLAGLLVLLILVVAARTALRRRRRRGTSG